MISNIGKVNQKLSKITKHIYFNYKYIGHIVNKSDNYTKKRTPAKGGYLTLYKIFLAYSGET